MTRPATGKVLLYAAALFIAGGVVGAMLMSHFAPVQQPLKLGRTGEIAAKIQTRLLSRLQLTPDQINKFEPFITNTSMELESIHKDCLDRIAASLDRLHAQIRPDLTPAQKEMLNQLEAERRDLLWQRFSYSTTNTAAH